MSKVQSQITHGICKSLRCRLFFVCTKQITTHISSKSEHFESKSTIHCVVGTKKNDYIIHSKSFACLFQQVVLYSAQLVVQSVGLISVLVRFGSFAKAKKAKISFNQLDFCVVVIHRNSHLLVHKLERKRQKINET